MCSIVIARPESEEEEKHVALSLWKLTVYFLAYTIVNNEREDQETAGIGKKSTTAAAAGKTKKKNAAVEDASEEVPNFEWAPYRERCLRALLESLVSRNASNERVWVDLGKIWPVGVPDEDFLSLYYQVGEAMMERSIRAGIYTFTRSIPLGENVNPTHVIAAP